MFYNPFYQTPVIVFHHVSNPDKRVENSSERSRVFVFTGFEVKHSVKYMYLIKPLEKSDI